MARPLSLILHVVFYLIVLCSPKTGARSCICVEYLSFQKMCKNAEVVAKVKVSKFQYQDKLGEILVPLAMDVKVEKVFKGKVAADKVRIWGNNGFLCAPFLDNFNRSEQYILALNKISVKYVNKWYFSANFLDQEGTRYSKTTSTYNDFIANYTLSNCGESWLRVRNGQVRGFLRGESLENPGVPADSFNRCQVDHIRKFIFPADSLMNSQ